MTSVQHELNDFLQSELYHTLGSYGTVVKRLRALDERVAQMRRRDTDTMFDAIFPSDVVTHTRRYNEMLRASLHQPVGVANRDMAINRAASRHPKPDKRLDGGAVRDRWVLDFYRTAIIALEKRQAGASKDDPEPLARLGHILAIVHDPQRRGADIGMPVAGRLARNKQRLAQAQELLGPDDGRDRAAEIVGDCLTNRDQDQLHTHTIGALVDAHMCMHHAEHFMSQSFGDKAQNRKTLDIAIDVELKRSLMLNTFVYVIGRAVPWIFAADEEERAFVLDNYEECCNILSPTYCIWIGNQLSLLALHRRAFTYLLMGMPHKSYNDFHKLRRFVRSLSRQLGGSIAQAPHAEAFLVGLDAFADHHSGRIYRGQHAHTTALRHFTRAADSLARLEEDEDLREMLRNSRWRIDLRMSQAKANYELGLLKRCLLCYAEAWRSFLELADTESLARANFLIVDKAIEWLTKIKNDSEIDKVELKSEIEPLVRQFTMVRGPAHLRTLAAEIMMRIGHVLFILRLPKTEGDSVLKFDPEAADSESQTTIERWDVRYPSIDHGLAYQSLLQASLLDPDDTLIATDLRKFEYWQDSLESDVRIETATDTAVNFQWPGGSGDFEEAARVVEYLLQCWLSETYAVPGPDDPPGERIARRLLAAFLAHTDSSNVKLAQVYRYLMQESSARRLTPPSQSRPIDRQTAIELVCLRRYSSFFPFLPRPSTFRVLGGGYFVRIDDSEVEGGIFGVVVDPGPNFVDNLYRCGYCLDEIHMIIVTHDHADHMAELDALLGLLGYRGLYGSETFSEHRKLAIVGNESVRQRYAFFNNSGRRDYVSVWSFEEWEQTIDDPDSHQQNAARLNDVRLCPDLVLERVETVEHEDAAGHLAQGFLLRAHANDSSTAVLFTSDTGQAPSLNPSIPFLERDPESGVRSLASALLEADVVVAHLSSVPLSELRQLAKLSEAPQSTISQTKSFQDLWESLRHQIASAERSEDDWARRQRFLLRQVQFGFHARPERELEQSETSGLEISPLSALSSIRDPSERHLYLSGLLSIAEYMSLLGERPRLLLVGELREELGTFRTRVASALNVAVLADCGTSALTGDIGLTVHLTPLAPTVLCTTCDLDNDLVNSERFHPAASIQEVCVKGEDEGIFYNCHVHEPLVQPHPLWIERIERYDPFGV
jgi:glyoxylase-like metal-dependent hydrolase (beta-lactamase superfamily II)